MATTTPATVQAPTPPAKSIAEQLGVSKSKRRRAHLRRFLIWGGLAIVVAGAIALWLRSRGGDGPRYVTQPVQRGDLTASISATGTLAPTNQVDVGSELSGILKTVEVDYDDRVTKGQVLARLDTTKLETQTRQVQAALEAARAKVRQTDATVDETRAQLARLEAVHAASKGRVPSAQELDAQRALVKRAESDRASARAAVSQAQAAVETNRTDLAKMVIRSPINGVVLVRSVDPGQTVAASFQAPVLFTIAEDLTKMDLELDIDEADIGQVKRAQAATFTVDAYPDRVFTATVAEVRFASETVEGVVTYKTVLHVENTDLSLRPGMTANADLVVQQVTHALLVPNAALRFVPEREQPQPASGDGSIISKLIPRPPRGQQRAAEEPETRSQRVWVLRGEQAVAVPVVIGMTDGSMTEVRGGELKPGEAVILDTAKGAR